MSDEHEHDARPMSAKHPPSCGYKSQVASALVTPVPAAHPLSCTRLHTHTIAAMKFALLSLAVAAAIGSACAQLDGLSACAINCLATAIPASGCSLYVLDVLSCPPMMLILSCRVGVGQDGHHMLVREHCVPRHRRVMPRVELHRRRHHRRAGVRIDDVRHYVCVPWSPFHSR